MIMLTLKDILITSRACDSISVEFSDQYIYLGMYVLLIFISVVSLYYE